MNELIFTVGMTCYVAFPLICIARYLRKIYLYFEREEKGVVRCKDCTEWDKDECECSHWHGFRENDFCSYGERK